MLKQSLLVYYVTMLCCGRQDVILTESDKFDGIRDRSRCRKLLLYLFCDVTIALFILLLRGFLFF